MFRITLFFLFFYSTGSLKAQYIDLLTSSKNGKKAGAYFEDYFKKVAFDSVEVFREIKKVEDFAASHSDRDLKNILQMVKLRYLRNRAYSRPSTYLIQLQKTKEFFTRINAKVYLSSVERRLGDYYFDEVNNYELAFQHFDEMFQLHRQVSLAEHPYKFGEMQLLVFRSYDFEDFQKCIDYAKATIEEEEKEKGSSFILSNLFFIAYSQRELGRLDSADIYMQTAQKLAKQIGGKAEEGIVACNMGLHQYLRGNYAGAAVNIKEGLGILEKLHEYIPSQIYYNALLTNIYISNDQPSLARQSFLKVKALQPKNAYPKDQLKVYDYLAQYYKKQGQPYEALTYMDSVAVIKRKIDRDYNSKKFLRAKQSWELAKLKGEEERESLRRNQLVLLLVLLLALVIMAYLFQMRKKEKALRNAEWALARAKDSLLDITKEIHSKSVQIEKLKTQIRNDVDEEILRELQKTTILTEEDWVNFRSSFEKVHAGFIAKIRAGFKNLTPAEIRYLVLLKLEFNNKEMAYALGISTESVRGILFRLRKKNGLTEETNLLELIHSQGGVA